ncbi:HAAS signaling domain-containing protein [Cellulomonas oligotrophica]|uniref:Uncharacterized protein n=1 Tax=Cellulomonas oligotrophica TaxID=931536 RepID=A0A7Y9FHK0_9CELL|nr:hypothetical protein [Cellulomonas oligotrophica]NYD87476.1 hypothetical protein [Cellulomonas oligotrophica]GIG33354.1 hypothetical protein Col01nite_25130 [Cellulomonas oligotrophica]
MSSTTDVPVARSVSAYAAAVRAQLADLGPEQVEELTDGLEANLTDALADDLRPHGADLVEEFGDPAAYAAELRAAAGVDAADGRPRRGPVAHLRALPAAARRLLAQARRQRWWPVVTEGVAAVRPLVWVVRGWVAFQLVGWLAGPVWVTPGWWPTSPLGTVAMVVCVALSVQVGRGRWLVGRRAAPLVWAGTAAALLLALPAAERADRYQEQLVAGDVGTTVVTVRTDPEPMDGVVVDGMPVSNLFVYDADGFPLEGVQIYDDRGRPVRTVFDTESLWSRPDLAEAWRFAGATDAGGRERWNVYPLAGWPSDELVPDLLGETPPEWAPRMPPFPFEKAPRIVPATGAAGPAGTADADTQADGDAQVAP